MIQAPSKEWIDDCEKWRGRLLTGKWAHWCNGWDGLPIDETCPEWPCECAPDPDFIKSCEDAGHPELPHYVEPERVCPLDHDALLKECTEKRITGECPDCGKPMFVFGTWYPIATAPKMKAVLIYAEQPGEWNSVHVAIRWSSSAGNGWGHSWRYASYQNLGDFVSGKPTHWMPQPEKP